MKFNFAKFFKGFYQAKDRLNNQKEEVQTEFKAQTAEQLGNYIDEQNKIDFKAKMRATDLPITYNSPEANGAFLFSRIELVPDGVAFGREIKHLLRLRVSDPQTWTYANLAKYFNTRIDVVQALEKRGLEMVKDAIVKERGRMVV